MILHIPHASTYIPPDLRASIVLSNADLARELLVMTDHYTDELFMSAAQPGDAVIRAPVSRLLVDMERFEIDAQEPMANLGMGVIYTRTHDGEVLRSQPTLYERERLLAEYYAPQHAALAAAVKDSVLRTGRALVLDFHSFPEKALPFELDQLANRRDICLGADEYHTPDGLLDLARDVFLRHGYSVAVNTPFAGCLVPIGSYQKDKRVQGLMIEVNRGLYMDEGVACA